MQHFRFPLLHHVHLYTSLLHHRTNKLQFFYFELLERPINPLKIPQWFSFTYLFFAFYLSLAKRNMFTILQAAAFSKPFLSFFPFFFMHLQTAYSCIPFELFSLIMNSLCLRYVCFKHCSRFWTSISFHNLNLLITMGWSPFTF